MEILIRPSKELSQDVWEAKQDPGELSLFGKPLTESGSISVIQVTGDVTLDEPGAALRFDHRHAHVLNLGHSDRTIVIRTGDTMRDRSSLAEISHAGDQRFLSDLRSASPELHAIGSPILGRVRAMRPDNDLTYYEKSHRYVEKPDNYFTVKIQPRARSLVITLRGEPKHFSTIRNLTIVPDQNGYSRTMITSASQIDDAVAAILRARRRGA